MRYNYFVKIIGIIFVILGIAVLDLSAATLPEEINYQASNSNKEQLSNNNQSELYPATTEYLPVSGSSNNAGQIETTVDTARVTIAGLKEAGFGLEFIVNNLKNNDYSSNDIAMRLIAEGYQGADIYNAISTEFSEEEAIIAVPASLRNESNDVGQATSTLENGGLSYSNISDALVNQGYSYKKIVGALQDAGASSTEVLQFLAGKGLDDQEIVKLMLKGGYSADNIVYAMVGQGKDTNQIIAAFKKDGNISEGAAVISGLLKAGFETGDVITAATNAGIKWQDITKGLVKGGVDSGEIVGILLENGFSDQEIVKFMRKDDTSTVGSIVNGMVNLGWDMARIIAAFTDADGNMSVDMHLLINAFMPA